MSVRCLQCGTILISEAVPRSANVQNAADNLDRRLYAGYGGLAGFVVGALSWFVLSQDESEVKAWVMVCSMAGGALGLLIAWHGRNRA